MRESVCLYQVSEAVHKCVVMMLFSNAWPIDDDVPPIDKRLLPPGKKSNYCYLSHPFILSRKFCDLAKIS